MLEGICSIPIAATSKFIAILGHPHSLQGGTQHNKVVVTLARACRDLNIISFRFNFRGVGNSAGIFDHGIGESDDMCYLAKIIQHSYPQSAILFAGFSFGSFVSYRAAAYSPHCLLISIAPPVPRFNFNLTPIAPSPWHIIQGEQDEVVEPSSVFDFAAQHQPPLAVHRFTDTGHFFHGQLLNLRQTITTIIQQELLL